MIIFSTQIKDFFGLNMETPPADFIEKWTAYFKAFPTFNSLTLAFASGTLGTILLIRRFTHWLPWGISAIVLSTALCMLFHLPVETIQSRFGDIPRSLPLPSLPCLSIQADKFREIFKEE